MKKIASPDGQDDGQMFFTYRRTRAERIAVGDLREVSPSAKAAVFRWPLAVASQLWDDIQTVPREHTRVESVQARWQHVFLLAATAARQIIRDRLPELKINVVLRTTPAPDRSREHVKHLCLTVERPNDAGGNETFSLGYCAEK